MMQPDLRETIASFSSLRALVLGEAILDGYLDGEATRICREAPVPILDVDPPRHFPGGAANTAANLRRLGARVRFLSAAGNDADGAILQGLLGQAGVECSGMLVHPGRRTLAKNRLFAGSQMLVRFDSGTTRPIDPQTEEALLGVLESAWAEADLLVVSDYGYGVLTSAVVERLRLLQARRPLVLAVDSKRLTAYRGAGVTVVKPNFGEAVRLLGLDAPATPERRAEMVASWGERILRITGADIAAVTIDSDGAILFERGRPPYRTYAKRAEASRPIGAGDTFISALALALAAGAHVPAAGEIASAAAALVVGKEATATCTSEELLTRVTVGEKWVPSVPSLRERVEAHRRKGRKIVFTNGCFDILHRGHIQYLNEAKNLAEALIVGVNSDASVRRLKGSSRPINPLEDRVHVLAALSCINDIVTFEDDTPIAIIREIRPDVYVKGGDHSLETLPEAPVVRGYGGEVRILPYTRDRSTTGIIERIRASAKKEETALDGRSPTADERTALG